MGMPSHKGDEGWIDLWLLLIFVFVNPKNITIQGIYNQYQISEAYTCR